MHEVKDLLTKNPYSNFAIHTSQSPPFAFDQNKNLHKEEVISRGKPVYSLYDEASRLDKFDHHKQLNHKIHDPPAPAKGHYRTKSSITEMYQKGLDRHEYSRGNIPEELTYGRAETSTNKHSMMKHSNHVSPYGKRSSEGLAANFEVEHNHRNDISHSHYNHEMTGYRRPSLIKDETPLDDYMQKNRGIGHGPTSPGEKLHRKTPIGIKEPTVSPAEKKKCMHNIVGVMY